MMKKFFLLTSFALAVTLAAGSAHAADVVEHFDAMSTWLIDTSANSTNELVLDYVWVDTNGDAVPDAPGTVHQPWDFAQWGASIDGGGSTNRQIKSKTVSGEGVIEFKSNAGSRAYAYAGIYGDDSAYGPAGSSFPNLFQIRVDIYNYGLDGVVDLAYLLRDAATSDWYISEDVLVTGTGAIEVQANDVALLDWFAVDATVAANMNLFASGDEDTTTPLPTGSALGWGNWDIDGVGLHAMNQDKQTLRFDNLTLDTVPEPMTIVLLGLGGLAIRRRRRS